MLTMATFVLCGPDFIVALPVGLVVTHLIAGRFPSVALPVLAKNLELMLDPRFSLGSRATNVLLPPKVAVR